MKTIEVSDSEHKDYLEGKKVTLQKETVQWQPSLQKWKFTDIDVPPRQSVSSDTMEMHAGLTRKNKKQCRLAYARQKRVNRLSAWAAENKYEREFKEEGCNYSVYATKYAWKVSDMIGIYNPCIVYMTLEGARKCAELLNERILEL